MYSCFINQTWLKYACATPNLGVFFNLQQCASPSTKAIILIIPTTATTKIVAE